GGLRGAARTFVEPPGPVHGDGAGRPRRAQARPAIHASDVHAPREAGAPRRDGAVLPPRGPPRNTTQSEVGTSSNDIPSCAANPSRKPLEAMEGAKRSHARSVSSRLATTSGTSANIGMMPDISDQARRRRWPASSRGRLFLWAGHASLSSAYGSSRQGPRSPPGEYM